MIDETGEILEEETGDDGSQVASGEVSDDAGQDTGEDVSDDADQQEQENQKNSEKDSEKKRQDSAFAKIRRELLEAKNSVAGIQQENQRLRQIVEAFAEKNGDDEESGEELVTRADLKKIIGEIRSDLKENATNTQRAQQLSGQRAQAIKEHPDFLMVLELTKDIAYKTPGLEERIMSSPNPFEAAYRIGVTHPDYVKPEKNTLQGSKSAKKVNTLSGSGGSFEKYKSEADRWMNMPKEDFEKELARVKNSQRK